MTQTSATTGSTAKSLAPIFISHGSPMVVARQSTPAFHFFVDELSKITDGVRAILMISAHWQAASPTISTAAKQETIHDFYGFPQPLYDLQYGVEGAPELAREIAEELGIDTDANRGLDHGAWMPMYLARPNADIPVFQLSMLGRGNARDHYELGKKLRKLGEKGILVLASGAMTHNLRALDFNEGPPQTWATDFTDWMLKKIEAGDIDALLDYRDTAPGAKMAHPEDDHLMPLYVALGAAPEGFAAKVLHNSYEFGNLAMTALRFYDQDELKTAA
ncbi:class III extradiol ring-cleavage dioxygenase [Thalassospira sp.]|uniref:DODA-type extradiol aromatic ring-opening family dioxygenase n=1 Tax=Thalassospira sp. TaxID=1912094 RepID=UPI000C6A3ECD|nr:class III extradiol ring-cleavage dioxygenase [Thalassospira sp.]MBC07924.1 dioxygenase [Thalassospira sp.]